MGLFSFIKGAGKKIFGRKDTPAPLTKEQALAKEVTDLGLPIDNLSVELGTAVIVGGTTDTQANKEKIIIALGNVEGVNAVEDNIVVTNPEPEAVFHTVKSGDTLSKISKEVYGDPMRYNEIFEANKPMLTHPDKIYPGQVLRIPVA
ncbi:MAG: peptidoglycan-binding protein LysM [Melioribacteraceae bacterium]|nr:peptidoglycan-binding protein LysM [Melioribacteraceae bacterium]